MVTIKIAEFKGMFFDEKTIDRAVNKARVKGLSAAGAFVRTRAQGLIKKAPYITRKPRGAKRVSRRRASSMPGSPPYSQTGMLKRWILFAYDRSSETVVIGPALLNRSNGAPRILEFGGMATMPDGSRKYIEPRPYMGPALAAEIEAGSIVAQFAGLVRT